MIRLFKASVPSMLLLVLMFSVAQTQAQEVEGEDPALNPALKKAGNLALRITADYVGVPQDRLRLQSVEPVQWEDSSLGCPKPGRRYLPAVIDGYKAVVSHGSRQYDVHIADGRGAVCEGVLRKGP
ncbi:hypothetical protein AWR36_011175 [Microbulbifer flavimaris]|uniref:Uncharacterized protein n=1 Tax=Microbulbifer flavimaris TaxID=1781068 RepID=A0ABX4I035_9GAMM|nr:MULTISPECIES: hypothetical protein [Microbulbifer]PCO05275.1 hypothetical protein AWR36_011175 [Microbulbifer flavimaris]